MRRRLLFCFMSRIRMSQVGVECICRLMGSDVQSFDRRCTAGRAARLRWSQSTCYTRSVDMISSRTNGNDSGDSGADAVSRNTTEQVNKANASGRTPLVFVHGLWLLPSSWDRWAALFDQAGYAPVSPGWPDDPETVEEAKAHPEVFARKSVGQIADHYAEVIGGLKKKPAVIGHSFGGLITQILAGRGLSAVTVAIDPAPFRGVLPLPISALESP